MFFSLNKKFIYTITIFFLFTATLFVYTFYNVYGSKLREEQKSTFIRNQQYLELLYQNTNLRNELEKISSNKNVSINKEILTILYNNKNFSSQQEEISIEKKRTAEMVQNYNERYEALQQAIQIVILSSILLILSMLLLWILIKRWVVGPIEHLTFASKQVSFGNFSVRIEQKDTKFFIDEFDELSKTFNQMLKNIEDGVIEIKNKEVFLQSLIDGIPDGIRVIDEDYNIIIANREYYRQISASEPCVGCKCYTSSQCLSSPCPSSAYTCPVNEIINKNVKSVKFVQQFAQNANRHLSINAAPLIINSKNGNQIYIVEAIRDLSDDIRFSHQQKLSSLGFLATSVAHEMKNHLGSIRMILEAVISKFYNDKADDDEAKKYLTLIYNQLVACINVPERLLKLSQFSNDEQLEIKYIESIKDVIALLDYEAKRNGVTININASAEDLTITGSEADFKMIIINLIQNAFKAMENGGTLDINISRTKSNLNIIKISDNGIGIAPDKLNRIFEPFYSDGKNSKNKGTGLGLSIVKSIIDKFHGHLYVESKENKGSCFTIEIPSTIKNKTASAKSKKKGIA